MSYHLRIDLPKSPFPVDISVKVLKALLPSYILATWPVHLNLLDLITLINDERYKLWSSYSGVFSYPHSLLDPNIHPKIQFSITRILRSSLNVRDHVSQPNYMVINVCWFPSWWIRQYEFTCSSLSLFSFVISSGFQNPFYLEVRDCIPPVVPFCCRFSSDVVSYSPWNLQFYHLLYISVFFFLGMYWFGMRSLSRITFYSYKKSNFWGL